MKTEEKRNPISAPEMGFYCIKKTTGNAGGSKKL